MKKSSKEILCDMFEDMLKRFNITYTRHNTYHIQITKVHNFYPSKGTYYNSKTEHKCKIPDFEGVIDFQKFLVENGSSEIDLDIVYPAHKIVEILQDCENLDDAIEFFNSH